MDEFDKLLADGAERRKRSALQRKVLDELRRTTRRSFTRGILFLAASGYYFWRINAEFLTDEPILKSDAVYLSFDVVICVSLFFAGLTSIFKNPRDLVLLELLEEKMKDET